MPVSPEYLHMVYPDMIFEALLYGRNSHDPSGKGRSVEAQVDEGRILCDTHGWPIIATFDKDVGRSASRHAKKRRDDFEALLEAIEKKQGTIVVAFEASRYYRDLEAYVRIRKACLDAGVLLCYNGEVYDLSKRADRKATARDAVDAEDEAEGIRDRNVRTQRRLVAQGWPAGRTPYGFRRRYDENTGDLIEQVPHPVRSVYVKAMFRRFVDQEAPQTTYAIAKWLNSEAASAHPSGKPWNAERVTLQLRLLAYAGRRIHKGKDVGKGIWKPIVSMETYQAAQAILDAPGRRTQENTAVQHLISGIATCGLHPETESKLVSGKRNGAPTYTCQDRGDTALRVPKFEAYVEEALLHWWQSEKAVEAFRQDEDTADVDRAQVLLAALEEQLDEARELAGTIGDNGRPMMSALSLAKLEQKLEPQIEKARADAGKRLGLPPELRHLVGRRSADEVWEAMTLSRKRELVRRGDPEEAWKAMEPEDRRRLVGWPNVEELWESMTLIEKRAAIRASVRIRLFPAHVRGAQTIRPGRIVLDFRGSPDFRLYVPGRQTPA